VERIAGPRGPAGGSGTVSEKDAVSRLAEAKRLVTQELHKQGTPDYDPRSHQRAIEAERKAQDAVDAEAAQH
jgi:hypothetical protein